jgi:hypothetical protein
VPSVSIVMSSPSICIGQSATYTVSGAVNYTFSTNPSSSPTFTSTTGVVSPTTHTSYHVIGTNQFGCTSATQQVLFVNPLPTISIVASPSMVCVGFPSTLIASAAPSSTAHVYSWAHGGNSSKSVVNPVSTAVYTVSGTNSITSCQNSQTISVAVFNPTFTATPDTAICLGSSITLSASGAASFSWTGGPNPSVSPVYVVSPTFLTVYTVSIISATAGNLKCPASKTIWLGIYLQPTVTAVSSRSWICRYETVDLVGAGADTYYWPALNQTGGTVTVSPNITTAYKLVGTDIYGCRDTGEVKVLVFNCHHPPIGFSEILRESFSGFPNPADKSYTMEAPGMMTINVWTSDGQLVKKIEVDSPGSVTLSTEDLSPGIYIVSGWSEGRLFREKIIIGR